MNVGPIYAGMFFLSVLALSSIVAIVVTALHIGEIPPSLTAVAGTCIGAIGGLAGNLPLHRSGSQSGGT